ncbi:MAG: extracellular solute-binding protein, partial [bacterium]|nr:extracellular solute-binding protein [bacterium]
GDEEPDTSDSGSSGEAETQAVQEAVAAWSAESGVEAEVIVASDLAQQLAQGFAGGNPADLFYMSTDQMNTFAANGSVLAYGDELANKDEFYPNLVDAFSIDGEFYCAPKDFSTLALVINDRLWSEAGLTEADYPTTWEELSSVAETLTTDDTVGLSFGPELQRVGVLMAQAGGNLVEDGAAVVNSDANVEAMTYLQENLQNGNFAFSSDLGAGWGGEAFGKELSAMVIEGNWITGAMTNDFPDVEYTAVELPAGPEGKGTIQYTNCWGIAADADNTEGAKSLVEYLTTAEQQMAFADAFGVMPSVSAAAEDWKSAYPEMEAFINGADYAINLPAMPGSTDVITEFNSLLTSVKDADVQTMLDSVQTVMDMALKG